jgi:hypothetical protein
MKKKIVQPKKRSFPWLVAALIAAGVGLLLAGGGFAFAAAQESNDPFCGSCHTQPESTFLARSQAAPVDNASFHTTKDIKCIDCHSGPGITGRIAAELLGASNAFKWFTGTAVQPAILLMPIGDENCLKCHQNVTSQRGRNNHFHGFLARWQQADKNAAHCVSCHVSHATGGDARQGYTINASIRPVCDACHRVLRTED